MSTDVSLGNGSTKCWLGGGCHLSFPNLSGLHFRLRQGPEQKRSQSMVVGGGGSLLWSSARGAGIMRELEGRTRRRDTRGFFSPRVPGAPTRTLSQCLLRRLVDTDDRSGSGWDGLIPCLEYPKTYSRSIFGAISTCNRPISIY